MFFAVLPSCPRAVRQQEEIWDTRKQRFKRIALGPHPTKAALGITSDERQKPFNNYISYSYTRVYAKAH